MKAEPRGVSESLGTMEVWKGRLPSSRETQGGTPLANPTSSLLSEQEEERAPPLRVLCLLAAPLSQPPSTGQEGSESGVSLTC